jgi:hypothetical protein
MITLGGSRYFLKAILLFDPINKHYGTLVKLKQVDGKF